MTAPSKLARSQNTGPLPRAIDARYRETRPQEDKQMEGYHVPDIRPEDAAEAENIFLSVTSDGDYYAGTVRRLRNKIRRNNPAEFVRSHCLDIANVKAFELERQGMCNGPISYLARAIAAEWLESYYRDHVAEGG